PGYPGGAARHGCRRGPQSRRRTRRGHRRDRRRFYYRHRHPEPRRAADRTSAPAAKRAAPADLRARLRRGAIGLARAATMAAAMPDKAVLFLVVELCSLTFRRGDASKSNIVASALFGDGAAGALLRC